METIYPVLRAIHIFFGMTALFVAPGAMAAVKGSLWHRRFGKVYSGPWGQWRQRRSL